MSSSAEWLGQYLTGTCFHHSSVQLSTVQFSTVQLITVPKSNQLTVFLSTAATVVATSQVYESSCGHLGIIVQNINWVKVVEVLICFSIEIFLSVVVTILNYKLINVRNLGTYSVKRTPNLAETTA